MEGQTMYIQIKELPSHLSYLLETQIGYRRADIEVIPTETVSPSYAGSDGQKGFFMMLNLETGAMKMHSGSWGGANMFNPENRVDLDLNSYRIPQNAIVVKGSTGHHCFATIYCSPSSLLNRSLPSPSHFVTEDEKRALYCFAAIKGGKYRRDELKRYKVTETLIQSLEDRGLLKSNKAGHRQITTEGRNARGNYVA